MIGRPPRRSTCDAWAFMATSLAPPEAPKRNSARANKAGFGASARSGRAAQKQSAETAATRPLPRAEVNRPASGMPRRAPAGRANNTRPSGPGFRSKARCTAGMLAAQDANTAPLMKNRTEMARGAKGGAEAARDASCGAAPLGGVS